MGTSDHFGKLCEKLRAKSRVDRVGDDSVLYLDDENISRFANALTHSKHRVQTLSLNISLLTTHTEGLEKLVRFVQTSAILEDIRLVSSDYRLTASALSNVVKRFLQAIDKNPSVERLALSNLSLDAESFAILLRHSKTLAHLSMASCSIVGHGSERRCPAAVRTAFGLNKSIESLCLVSLEESLLIPILEQMKTHRQLNRLEVSYGSAVSAEAIGDILGSSTTRFLDHLVLRESSLISLEPVVRNMMRSKANVKRLDLIGCDIDAVSASLLRTLFRSEETKIQHVCFIDVDLEDDSNLEDIFESLVRCKSMRRLLLHNVKLQPRDYQALTQLLQNNKYLTHVDLDRTILKHIGIEAGNRNGNAEANRSGDPVVSSRAAEKTKRQGGRAFYTL